MILVDSAVCAAMKKDVKGAGYLAFGMMLEDKCWMGLKGNGWIVLAKLESMPRKVLGLIVEHAGGIPGIGTAWSIQKPRKGDIQRQDVMFGVVEQEVRELLEVNWDTAASLARMALSLDGYGLWQDRENLNILRMAPRLEDLAVWMGKAAGNGGYVCKAGVVSWCFVLKDLWDGDHEVWRKHLEQMSWV